MSNEIKTFFFGKECHDCKALGVDCLQVGIFTFGAPAENGQTVIYIDDEAMLRTTEPIDECPAITGKETKKTVVAKLRKTSKKLNNNFSVNRIGNY